MRGRENKRFLCPLSQNPPKNRKNRRAKPPKPPRKFKILSFRGVFLKKFRFFIDYYVIIIRNVDF
ncbi:hypothetical protein [Helicobacter pylori]|uniref:hypothetical protein n=1 Tax=Helicobacter pylori TaxID=210 RepID=UPI000EACF6E8|nr:hypothetical protein DDP41_04330 [Helicobacter pylori]RKU93321.1 hypothetical protein DDP39_03195 [Helicobacter pylori]